MNTTVLLRAQMHSKDIYRIVFHILQIKMQILFCYTELAESFRGHLQYFLLLQIEMQIYCYSQNSANLW